MQIWCNQAQEIRNLLDLIFMKIAVLITERSILCDLVGNVSQQYDALVNTLQTNIAGSEKNKTAC